MEQQAVYGNKPPDVELIIPNNIRVRSDISWFEKTVISAIMILPPGKGKNGGVAEYIAEYLNAPMQSVYFVLRSAMERKILKKTGDWYKYLEPISWEKTSSSE